MEYFDWALSEPTDLTAINGTSVLVARVTEPGAFVLSCDDESGRILMNGLDVDLGEDTVEYISLMDVVLTGMPDFAVGRTRRSEPEDDES